jgi:hypothetical protein
MKHRLDSWGAYISALRSVTEEPLVENDVRLHVKKVEALVQQIKDQDRNLIMHPEIVLKSDDAMILFDTAKAAITKMAERLPTTDKMS